MIENRVQSSTGSQWMIRNYRTLLKTQRPFEAAQTLTAKLYEKQEKGYPISSWSNLDINTTLSNTDRKLVKHKMNKDIFSVRKNDSLELVLNIMRWKNIHHMPVINNKREIIGLLSWTDLKSIQDDKEKLRKSVKSFMVKEIITANQFDTLEAAKHRMTINNICCLPVIRNKKLIGIITTNDF